MTGARSKTAQPAEDPFAGFDGDKDPFDEPRSSFVRVEDLLDRLVLVIPTELREEESTLPGRYGETFEKIVADTIVLDGPVSDVIEEIPLVVSDMHWSGAVVVGQLRGKVKVNQAHVGRGMVLGRVGQQPSKTKGFGKAWVLLPPTDDDKVLARPVAKEYLATVATDPFATAKE